MNIEEQIDKEIGLLIADIHGQLVGCMWDGRHFQTSPAPHEYQRVRTRALNLVSRVCGEDSPHYKTLATTLQAMV